jgi:AraC-like DNA-binding protein
MPLPASNPADARILSDILWPGAEYIPAASGPQFGQLLRMYAPDGAPQSGALYTEEMDIDSPWHYHDMHQLTYAFEGIVEVEDSRGRYISSPNLATWVPAGVQHRSIFHGVRTVSIFFTKDQVNSADDRTRVFVVSPLMREMMKEVLRWPLHGPEAPLRSSFIEAMALLSSEAIEQDADLVLPTGSDPRINRALSYTVQHTDAKLSEVCGHAGMSERTLRRRIMAEVGMTWEAYRQLSRLRRAVSLLNESDVPITEVAAQCGFGTASAFSRAFRLVMHETPREYRNRLSGG